jgi:low temperature requirement protein LtrA
MNAQVRLRTEGGMEPGRRVTWLELFFDLVFVAAVAQVGTHLRDDYSSAGLLRFSLLFVLIWWAWLGHTSFSTRFDTDDLVQRGLTWLQMFLVAVMAINSTGALDSRDSAGFAAAYSIMRLVLVAQYLRAWHIRRARPLITRYAASCGVAAALWLTSALVPAPLRFWLWALALAIDVVTPLVTTRHMVDVPHDAAHLPERYGLFTIILMGESMVAVMTGMAHQEYWSIRAAASAVFGMGLIVTVWWCYFDVVDAAGEHMVRARRDAVRFQAWSYGHLPLYLGIAVTGVGLEHVIAKVTKEPLHTSEAVILGGAVAAVTMAMLLLAATRRTQSPDQSAPRATRHERRAPHSRHQSRTPVATAHTALDTLR